VYNDIKKRRRPSQTDIFLAAVGVSLAAIQVSTNRNANYISLLDTNQQGRSQVVDITVLTLNG
jgi:hypothetical protein